MHILYEWILPNLLLFSNEITVTVICENILHCWLLNFNLTLHPKLGLCMTHSKSKPVTMFYQNNTDLTKKGWWEIGRWIIRGIVWTVPRYWLIWQVLIRRDFTWIFSRNAIKSEHTVNWWWVSAGSSKKFG